MTRFLIRAILEHGLPSSNGPWNLCLVKGGTQPEILATARHYWKEYLVCV